MNKQLLKIAVISLLVIVAVYGSWHYLSRGQLKILSTVPVTEVLINGRAITLDKNSQASLPAWNYNISIKKNYYQTYSASEFIGFWQTKTLVVELVPDAEGEALLSKSRKVVAAFAEYTNTDDLAELTTEVKNYLTAEALDNLEYEIAESVSSRDTTTPITYPKFYLPISSSYIEGGSRTVSVVLSLHKTADTDSLSQVKYSYIRLGSSWKINNISYEY